MKKYIKPAIAIIPVESSIICQSDASTMSLFGDEEVNNSQALKRGRDTDWNDYEE